MTTKKPAAAPLAHRVPAEPTRLILDFCAWIERETGYKPDPLSVYLGSALRGEFQKSPANQKRLAAQAERIAKEQAAREQRKAEREAKAAQPNVEKAAPKTKSSPAPVAKGKAALAPSRRRPLKGSTLATAEGVVIAQQRHIEAGA